MNKANIFSVAGIGYSWEPILNFNKFEIEIFANDQASGEFRTTGVYDIYVNGNRQSLEILLNKWNESPIFKYAIKENTEKPTQDAFEFEMRARRRALAWLHKQNQR